MKSLFTGIDSSSHTAVCSAQVINSLMSLFYPFIYSFVITNLFFFKSIAWNLLSRIPFPDSGFRVLVLPPLYSQAMMNYLRK